MEAQEIPLHNTTLLHPMIGDYLAGDVNLDSYIAWHQDREGFAKAMEARPNYQVDRRVLISSLQQQYKDAGVSLSTQSLTEININLLANPETYTITTGHQLCILTGPLYFIYKIVSAIKLARQLKDWFPEKNFVPVYWMATEDHDFEEVNHIHVFGKKLVWEDTSGGAVGRLDLDSLQTMLAELKGILGESEPAAALFRKISEAYAQGNLSQATRKFVHELFGSYGIVILDADQRELKAQFSGVMRQEILESISFPLVEKTSAELRQTYNLPLNPREINLFYLRDHFRARIIRTKEGNYQASEAYIWTEPEIVSELEGHPERFSPNVVMRPMYQETILPNLAYIGGTNELAYWMQLKKAFESYEVFYPVLVLRDSWLWLGKRTTKDMDQLKINADDLLKSDIKQLEKTFYERNELNHPSEAFIDQIIDSLSGIKDSLQGLPVPLITQTLKQSGEQINQLKKTRKEIRKTLEEQNAKLLEKVRKIYDTVYPEGQLQERYANFIPYYLQYGDAWIDTLIEQADPLHNTIKVVREA